MASRAFAFAASVAVAASVNLEYPGFIHIQNWDSGINVGASTSLRLSRLDGGQIALNIGKHIVTGTQDRQANVMSGINWLARIVGHLVWTPESEL